MAENCSAGVADPSFARWISDAMSRDAEALTKALQFSLSSSSSPSSLPQAAPLPLPPGHRPALVRSGNLPGARGRTPKRKSHASRRKPTTVISVDPADFRLMVQRVTGVRLGAASPDGPVTELEHAPRAGRPPPPPAFLPITLDTSAFVLGRTGMVAPEGVNCLVVEPVVNGPAPELEPFPGFPTLESWGLI